MGLFCHILIIQNFIYYLNNNIVNLFYESSYYYLAIIIDRKVKFIENKATEYNTLSKK